tara:strand:- start:306 stop:542 length:237 start_codon:yes stop_codon:yes gene_type:complete
VESTDLDAWDRLMQKVDRLENMLWGLYKKVTGPPMTDEERAEWAKNIQGELPPVREGHDCEDHKGMSHKEWEKSQEKK